MFTHLRIARCAVRKKCPVVTRRPRTTNSDHKDGYDAEARHQQIAGIVDAQLSLVLGDPAEESENPDLRDIQRDDEGDDSCDRGLENN
jgi:hypothetical protein